jgi:hypothetical protein
MGRADVTVFRRPAMWNTSHPRGPLRTNNILMTLKVCNGIFVKQSPAARMGCKLSAVWLFPVLEFRSLWGRRKINCYSSIFLHYFGWGYLFTTSFHFVFYLFTFFVSFPLFLHSYSLSWPFSFRKFLSSVSLPFVYQFLFTSFPFFSHPRFTCSATRWCLLALLTDVSGGHIRWLEPGWSWGW